MYKPKPKPKPQSLKSKIMDFIWYILSITIVWTGYLLIAHNADSILDTMHYFTQDHSKPTRVIIVGSESKER